MKRDDIVSMLLPRWSSCSLPGVTLVTKWYYCSGLLGMDQLFFSQCFSALKKRTRSWDCEPLPLWIFTEYLRKLKAPVYPLTLVTLTWDEHYELLELLFTPNVTCSVEQMTVRFSLASVEAQAAILRFYIRADIGWMKKKGKKIEEAVLYSL